MDGRFGAAKKAAFIIQADHLEDYVYPDWSGIHKNEITQDTISKVEDFVKEKIHELSASDRADRKTHVLTDNVSKIRDLSSTGQNLVVEFVDEALGTCKRLTQEDLSNLVSILVNLEQTKSGYSLVKELSKCSPKDLDTWNSIISKWDASTAQLVLEEIDKRMILVDKLSELIKNPDTKELQELQPVFDIGLWIFGPEYEGLIDFYSNKTLKTIIETEFGGKKDIIDAPKNRPDFVVSVYSSDSINPINGLSTEIAKILIIELKKTGVSITDSEINQGKSYAKALKKSGSQVKDSTPIDVYVLGTKLDSMARYEQVNDLNIRVFPCTYDGIVQQANARLLYLKRKIEKLNLPVPKEDDILRNVLLAGDQMTFTKAEL